MADVWRHLPSMSSPVKAPRRSAPASPSTADRFDCREAFSERDPLPNLNKPLTARRAAAHRAHSGWRVPGRLSPDLHGLRFLRRRGSPFVARLEHAWQHRDRAGQDFSTGAAHTSTCGAPHCNSSTWWVGLEANVASSAGSYFQACLEVATLGLVTHGWPPHRSARPGLAQLGSKHAARVRQGLCRRGSCRRCGPAPRIRQHHVVVHRARPGYRFAHLACSIWA